MSSTDNGMDTSSTPATPGTAPNPSDLATFANLLAQSNQAFSQSVGHSLNATQQAIQDLAQITAQHNAEAQAVGGGLGAGGLDGEEGQGHHGHQIRVRAPDLFKGGSNDVERFIHDVEDCIELSQGVISTGRSKCLYMSRYIESPAWYHLVRTQHAELLDDFNGFIAAFRGHFDDPDKTTTSIRHLEALHQGRRSASQLYAEFVEITQFVDISNDTKLSYFKRALADDTACQVAGSATMPTTFTEFAEFAIKVDNRLCAYKEDRHARTTDRQHAHRVIIPHSTVMPTAPPIYSSSSAASNEPVPMDVDTVRISRLTPDERRRRQTYGLCIYCGSSGHYRDTCPLLVSVGGASGAMRGGGRASGRGGGKGQSVGGRGVGIRGGGFGGQRGGGGAGRGGSVGGSGGYGRGRGGGQQGN